MQKVEVLMSTYNGEKYIEKQIESILYQSGVNVHITIRDDGSKDDTLRIIGNIINRNAGKIRLVSGENLGYRRSFLALLNLAEEADFYAFSDQDDIWMKDKLSRATEILCSMKKGPALYASSVKIVDEQLNCIGFNDVSKMPMLIESYFTRSRLAGCTFVFSRELKKTVQRFSNLNYPQETMPDHDFIVGACAFAIGEVYLDRESFIYHVRHNKSVTSGGNGFYKRILTEYQLVFKRKCVRYNVAKMMLKEFEKQISEEKKEFLLQIAHYKNSPKDRLKLLRNSKMHSGMLLADWEQKIKILNGSY